VTYLQPVRSRRSTCCSARQGWSANITRCCAATPTFGALHRWRRRNRLASVHRLEGTQVDWAELVIAMSRAVDLGQGRSTWPAGQGSRGGDACSQSRLTILRCVGRCSGLTSRRKRRRSISCASHNRSFTELPAEVGAGARWLEGRALDLAGDPLGAVAAFEGAEATGQEHAACADRIGGISGGHW